MSMAYTPGLKRKKMFTSQKIRMLPIKGKILVKIGDTVTYSTIVAHSLIPGNVHTVDAASALQLEGEYDENKEEFTCHLTKHMVKKEGDAVDKDELLAKKEQFFGMIKLFCKAPVQSTIESISNVTGKILLREPPIPMQLEAYVPGKVVDILPQEGVVIETSGVFIQGIFGIGGEKHGEILVMTKSEQEMLTDDQITSNCSGKILVIGSLISCKALQKAATLGVKGVIVGGIDGEDLRTFLGYEIGVAITGKEDVNLTLIVTEGFGEMAMAKKTFQLFKENEGKLACINGATQIRAGVIRPEIIIPSDTEDSSLGKTGDLLMEGMKPGLNVRIVKEPYFGRLGTITSLPPKLYQVDTESMIRVLIVELDNGTHVVVPRANVELIEE
jgi:hypothetical protein